MKLAVVDLETTSLRADAGFLLCGGVLPLGGKPTVVGLRDSGVGASRQVVDKRLVVCLRDLLEQFDGWVTWNGLLFDLPYLNDRLLLVGERPLEKRLARGLDMMYHARAGKSTFTSSRLDWVARALRCPYRKTDLDIAVWKEAEAEALRGFQHHAAYDKIVVHNAWDLRVTEYVFHKLKTRIQTISKW